MASTTDTDAGQRRPGPFPTGPVIEDRPANPGPVESGERDARFDNQPPLGERIAMEFEEELRAEGLVERAAELAEAATRAPACDSNEAAGKIGDFCKQASAFEKALEAVREKHNRPLIEARSALKGRTDQLFAPIASAVTALRQQLNAFMRAEDERVQAERRKAEEERQRLQREADERASLPEYAPRVEAAKIAEPVARGDYGSRVGTRTVWCHEIESVRQLPDRLLKHPRVIEALDKVIAAEIRAASGQATIKGVRIWADKQAAVR